MATAPGASMPGDARVAHLLSAMKPGALKEHLQRCAAQPTKPTAFSIGHRGAPLKYPEHTEESYRAAARMGAGLIECDVTFTKARKLVCRHAPCDLAFTTDILTNVELARTCSYPLARSMPAPGTDPAPTNKSVGRAISGDGDLYLVLDVLARQVGVRGVFSDWPATVTYYADCLGL